MKYEICNARFAIRFGLAASLFVLQAIQAGPAFGQVLPLSPKPAPVDGYAIHADGGLIYDPLRREAVRTGQLDACKNTPTETRRLTLGNARLEIRVPKAAKAYDVIPIAYTLEPGTNAVFPVAVEAVAFEDKEKSRNRNLFDLSLPGQIDFGVEYLGSVTGQLLPEEKHNLAPDLTDTPKHYPNIARAPMVRSGVVSAGDLVWFQFRLTNTGNTIFDPEGFGGGQLIPELLRKDTNGVYRPFCKTYNLYYRNPTYWYPGEKWEPWIIFSTPKAGMPADHYRLEPGEYKIRLEMTCRGYRSPDPAVNYSDGPRVFIWEQPVTVAGAPQMAAVPPGSKVPAPGDIPNKLPAFIHTMEEFMTAFDCHLKNPGDGKSIQGVLYLQVAPWAKQVVVRLISGAMPQVATASVPLKVDAESPAIRLPEKLPHTVAGPDGLARPVFFSQTMADMRVNVQMGPYPEKYIRNGLREMKELGVNFISTTAMPWLYDDRWKRPFNYNGDALKYALDVARVEKLQVEAWAQYPFDRGGIGEIARWLTGKNYRNMSTAPTGYGDGGAYISSVEPKLPAANADVLLYNFSRWGDLFFQEADGTVPVGVEDTRGWMRDDINVRFPVGATGVAAFRQWLRSRYGTIEKVNQAWGTSFTGFDTIDPETHQLDKYNHGWTYDNPAYPFHDWNAAVTDFDRWRTEVRVGNYRDYLALIKDRIPNAKVMMRSEGGNVIVAGLDPESRAAHFRHVYYGQRRLGAIAEILAAAGIVGYHADYTTMPYTPTELRQLVRMGVSQGITPAYLPQFDNMRDIAINERYGKSYQADYNLDQQMKGYPMHVLTASYPWYQVMVEEGGIPGVLWEDIMCDGVVMETQKRELKFYRAKLDQALGRLPAAARKYTPPPQGWRKGGVRSYALPEAR